MSTHHGKSGVVYLSTSAGGSASVINLTGWSLEDRADRIDCTAADDENHEYEAGIREISGSLSGYWDSASDALYDASRSGDGARIYLYPNRNLVHAWVGLVWLDFSIVTTNAAAVQVAASFVGVGDVPIAIEAALYDEGLYDEGMYG